MHSFLALLVQRTNWIECGSCESCVSHTDSQTKSEKGNNARKDKCLCGVWAPAKAFFLLQPWNFNGDSKEQCSLESGMIRNCAAPLALNMPLSISFQFPLPSMSVWMCRRAAAYCHLISNGENAQTNTKRMWMTWLQLFFFFSFASIFADSNERTKTIEQQSLNGRDLHHSFRRVSRGHSRHTEPFALRRPCACVRFASSFDVAVLRCGDSLLAIFVRNNHCLACIWFCRFCCVYSVYPRVLNQHTHTHIGTNSHTKASETGSPSNETRHSKVLRMHFLLYVLFSGSMRRCKGNECAKIFFSRCLIQRTSIAFRFQPQTPNAAAGRNCLVSLWWKKMNDFAYGKIYSPFKSFVNCDRVDMIACIQFVFVEMWSAVVALIRLAPANVCNQYFCFYFCFALPSASQSLSWKYYSFLLFGTNTHAHLADDATTTRPCTFHVHPTQYIYLKYRKYFVRFH